MTYTDTRDPADELDPLAAAVYRARKREGMTQAELAAAAGVSRRTVVMLENGGDCTLSTLRRFYDVLDINMQPVPSRRPTLDDMNAENNREMFGGAAP